MVLTVRLWPTKLLAYTYTYPSMPWHGLCVPWFVGHAFSLSLVVPVTLIPLVPNRP
jgi:hypothetical protein